MKTLRVLLDQRDLLLAALLAVLAVLSVLLGLPVVVRALFAVPLVLFLPGYALVNALLPALVIPAVERLLLAVGASIALAVLVGLGLGVSAVSLDAISWAVSLTALTLALLAIAWARRVLHGQVGPAPRLARMSRSGGAMVFIAVLVIVDSLLGARLIAGQQDAPTPAQLWLVPLTGDHAQARVGMRADGDGGQYAVIVSSGGIVVNRFELSLQAEQTWETIVGFSQEVRSRPIVARLYEDASTVESRYVVLQPATDGG